MSYNGWTNYETWNVNLWIDNDECLYRDKQHFIASAWREVTGEDVETFFREYMGSTTPDFETLRENGETIDPINFDEIAEHWEAERQEYEMQA